MWISVNPYSAHLKNIVSIAGMSVFWMITGCYLNVVVILSDSKSESIVFWKFTGYEM